MMNFPQKFAQQSLGAALRVVTLTLFLIVFGAGAALAQTRAYVANERDITVSVIDPATNSVVATIPVGAFPEATATNTVVATVPVGNTPQYVAFGVRAQGPTNPTFSNQGDCIRFVNHLNH